MKIKRPNSLQRGAVLVTALVLALLVGLVVGALLIISQQHNYLTARSQTWNAEIPIAEAGIEEAMEHINSSNSWLMGLVTNGWTRVGSNVVKSRELGDGYYYTSISTSEVAPAIVSIGFGRIPLQTNFTRRVVTALARKGIVWGFIGINGVEMNGTTTYIDSFNSSDPRYSSNGLYHPLYRRDMAGVATVSSARPALNTGTAKIYGFAATGPGGSVSGTVGDGTWCASQTGIQTGHASDDFNMAFSPIGAPAVLTAALAPAAGVINGTNYGYVLGNDDYKIDGDLSLPVTGHSGGDLIVTGRARLYVTGKTTVSGHGKIIIATNGTLEMYLGDDASLNGQGTFNFAGVATACSVFGLPTCKSISYGGGSSWTSLIYAPQAEVAIGGGGHFYGSIVGATLKFTGTPELHYDEALGGASPIYKVIAWEEL